VTFADSFIVELACFSCSTVDCRRNASPAAGGVGLVLFLRQLPRKGIVGEEMGGSQGLFVRTTCQLGDDTSQFIFQGHQRGVEVWVFVDLCPAGKKAVALSWRLV
jgi:hypothetical protein